MSYFQGAFRGDNHWLKYIFGVFLIALGYIIGQMPLYAATQYQISKYQDIGTPELLKFEETLDFSIIKLNSNVGLVLMIALFIFATFGLWFALKIHNKTFKDIIRPYGIFSKDKIVFSFLLWFGLTAIFEFLCFLNFSESYRLNYSGFDFFILLFVSLTLIPIQTSFEEFVFRGYFLQGFGIFTKNKWAALIITSVLFSLVHSDNPEIDKFGFWNMQPYYIGAGLILGLLVILDDGLELALGFHAATNIFGASMVSYSGSVLQTDSLFKADTILPWLMTLLLYISSFIFFYVCYKKYGWDLSKLRSKGRIYNQQVIESDNGDHNTKSVDATSAIDNITNNNITIPWEKLINNNE